MADENVPVDENGIPVQSLAQKYLAPKPDPTDLTRVKTGEGPADYVYVDPASLFALERLMQAQPLHPKKLIKVKMKEFKKFVRDVAEKAHPYWPTGGYLAQRATGFTRFADQLNDGDPAAPPIAAPAGGDSQLNIFEDNLSPESQAWADAAPPEPDLVDDAEDMEDEDEELAPIAPVQ